MKKRKKPLTERNVFSVTLDKATAQTILKQAAEETREPANFITTLIRRYLEKTK